MKNLFYEKSAAFGRALIYAYQYILFRPKVIYTSRKAKEEIEKQPVIYISNHVGHNDGQMMYMLLKNSSLMIAKDQYDKKIVHWVTTGANFLPVDRFGMDIQWVRLALEEIKQGRNMIIFPEGETEKEGHLITFKPGFAMLAVMARAKVVPVYIDGEYNKLFGRRLRVYIGEPTELDREGFGLNAEYLKAQAGKFQAIYETYERKA